MNETHNEHVLWGPLDYEMCPTCELTNRVWSICTLANDGMDRSCIFCQARWSSNHTHPARSAVSDKDSEDE